MIHSNGMKLYRLSDIAEMTGLTDRTIRNYLKNGDLKGTKIGGQWRFTEKNIEDLFANREFNEEIEETFDVNIKQFFENVEDRKLVCLSKNIKNEKIDNKALTEIIMNRVSDFSLETFKLKINTDEEVANVKIIIRGETNIVNKVEEFLDEL